MNFLLIHGAYHGAWCWDLLREQLVLRGHSVVAPELPISSPLAGTGAYAETALWSISDLEEPVVVAHSMGGLVAPLVATERQVRTIIFLAAFLPKLGSSPQQQRGAEPIDPEFQLSAPEFVDLGDDVWRIGEETAIEMFFHDATDALARWAVSRLRPQCYRWMTEVTPLEVWPDVPVASIACSDDRAINPDWVRSAARERLGVEAIEVPGGHSPFLTRPDELADLLEQAVR